MAASANGEMALIMSIGRVSTLSPSSPISISPTRPGIFRVAIRVHRFTVRDLRSA
jgi:hypothetical protein